MSNSATAAAKAATNVPNTPDQTGVAGPGSKGSVDSENDTSSMDNEHEDELMKERGNWGSKIEFILAAVGNMVGLGNVWRFPYLVYKHGGGAFVIPYVLMIFLIGVPILLLEIFLGQFTALGPVHAYASLSPLFQGLGITSVITSGLIAIYYNVVLAWSMLYFYETCRGQKWQTCDNSWNDDKCIAIKDLATSNITADNTTEFVVSTKQFFDKQALRKSDHIDEISPPAPALLVCLLLSWIIVAASLIKGVKSTGKVVYFTALFPYVLLIILFFRGVTLEGSGAGLKYYFEPDFSKIGDLQVWRSAIVQVFFSIGGGVGIMLTYGSYNKFHNDTLIRDSFLLVIGDMLTSIFAGAFVFSMVGFIAHKTNMPIETVLGEKGEGVSLAFIAIPEGIGQLPGSVFWSLCFFFMLFLLGIDSSFGYVECVTSFIFDYRRLKGHAVNKPVIVGSTCAFFFCCGIIMTTSAGIYFFNLLDYFAAGVPVLFVGAMECILVSHIYRMEHFLADLKYMTGYTPSAKTRAHFNVSLWSIAPLLILMVLFADLYALWKGTVNGQIDHHPMPGWSIALGWFVILLPLLAVPFGMIRFIRNYKLPNKTTTLSCWSKLRAGLNVTLDYKEHAKKSGQWVLQEHNEEPADVIEGAPVKPTKDQAGQLKVPSKDKQGVGKAPSKQSQSALPAKIPSKDGKELDKKPPSKEKMQ